MRYTKLAVVTSLILNLHFVRGQQLVITSLGRNGTLTWSNSFPSINHFSVKWASRANGPWTNSCPGLLCVENTNTEFTVSVPMYSRAAGAPAMPLFYRVVGVLGMPTNGLVAYYPLDGDLVDYGPANNSGTLYGPVATTDRFARASHALALDGINDYGVIPHVSSIDFGDEDFTVVIWAKVSEPQFPSGSRDSNSILEKWNDDLQVPYPYAMRIKNKLHSTPGLVGFLRYNGAGATTTVDVNGSVNDGVWHQLAFIKRGKSIEAYRDGVLSNIRSDFVGAAASNNKALIIGRRSANNGQYFRGELDTLLIYNRALQQEELEFLYNAAAEP